HIAGAVAELLGQRLAALVGHVGQDHPGPLRRQPARGRAAEAAGAAGHENRGVRKVHRRLPLSFSQLLCPAPGPGATTWRRFPPERSVRRPARMAPMTTPPPPESLSPLDRLLAIMARL